MELLAGVILVVSLYLIILSLITRTFDKEIDDSQDQTIDLTKVGKCKNF